jgi:tripartite-type tricarboxylate transporter receptor subunit TctC
MRTVYRSPKFRMTRMRAALYGLAVLPGLLSGAPASAQTYPAKSVRVIVPYPPGGGNDIIARAVVDELSRRTSQQFFVDNRPGASTIIGAELAIKAPPDGYTLFVSSQTTLAIVPNLKTKVPYDPLRDFEPVSLLATQPYLVVTHPSLPVHNVAQLAALAKSRPGKIVYASSGVGTGGHLSGELFKMMTRTDMLHVPYKGGAQAVNDLVGGHVSVMFATMSSVYQQAMGGRVRPIAITSSKRSPAAPGVPTVAESGVPGYETVQWIAMSGPRGLPKPVIDKLNAELVAGNKSPELRERLSSQGYDPEVCTPQQLAHYIKVEFARFGKLIRAINLKDE